MKRLRKYKTVSGLLVDKRRWTTGQFAADSRNSPVDPQDARACRFCLSGAIRRIYGFETPGARYAILRLLPHIEGLSPVAFNDSSSHRQVLAAVRKAKI
jgi:hypothetical protein